MFSQSLAACPSLRTWRATYAPCLRVHTSSMARRPQRTREHYPAPLLGAYNSVQSSPSPNRSALSATFHANASPCTARLALPNITESVVHIVRASIDSSCVRTQTLNLDAQRCVETAYLLKRAAAGTFPFISAAPTQTAARVSYLPRPIMLVYWSDREASSTNGLARHRSWKSH